MRFLVEVSDENQHAVVDPDANSIAIIVKHVGGNLRSRFTDCLTTDGEKATRNRDDEFEMPVQASRTEVLEWWESGCAATLSAIDALTVDDLDRTLPGGVARPLRKLHGGPKMAALPGRRRDDDGFRRRLGELLHQHLDPLVQPVAVTHSYSPLAELSVVAVGRRARRR